MADSIKGVYMLIPILKYTKTGQNSKDKITATIKDSYSKVINNILLEINISIVDN